MRRRITENHPLHQKILKAEEVLNDLGIVVNHNGMNMVITDTVTGLEVTDSESNDCFPRFIDSYFLICE